MKGRIGNNIKKILSDIGLGEDEISAYIALLEEGSATAQSIAKKTRISPIKIYGVLEHLLDKHFCRKIVGTEEIYVPVPPIDAARNFLKNKRLSFDGEINAISTLGENLIPELNSYLTKVSPSEFILPHQRIKVIQRRQELINALRSIHYTAEKELRVIIRPPFTVGISEMHETDASAAYYRGVKFTIILDSKMCEYPDLKFFAKDASSTPPERTEVFFYPNVNFELTLADEKEAMLTLFKRNKRKELWIRDKNIIKLCALAFENLKRKSIRLTPEKVDEICQKLNT